MQATSSFDFITKADDDIRKINKNMYARYISSSERVYRRINIGAKKRRVFIPLSQPLDQMSLLVIACDIFERSYNERV